MDILQPLARAVVKSFNFWVGFAMNAVGLSGFFFPDLIPSLNWSSAQVSIPRGAWLILSFIGIVLMVWTVIQEYQKELKRQQEKTPIQPAPSSIGSVTAGTINNSTISNIHNEGTLIQPQVAERGQSVIFHGNNNIFSQGKWEEKQEDKTPVAIDLKPKTIPNEKYVSVIVWSPPDQGIDCRCTLDSIEKDGKIDEALRLKIAGSDPHISWSKGNESSTKHIDSGSNAILNIAMISWNGLVFNMHSGDIRFGEDESFGVGKYKANLTIRGKADGKEFSPIPHSVSFDCYKVPAHRVSAHPRDDDTVSIPIGLYAGLESSSDRRDHLYLKIIREIASTNKDQEIVPVEADIDLVISTQPSHDKIIIQVVNNETSDLKNCHVKLDAVIYHGKNISTRPAVISTNSQKLSWVSAPSPDGYVTVRGMGGHEEVSVVSVIDNEFFLTHHGNATPVLPGLYVIGIRLDGDMNGKPIEYISATCRVDLLLKDKPVLTIRFLEPSED